MVSTEAVAASEVVAVVLKAVLLHPLLRDPHEVLGSSRSPVLIAGRD